MSKNKHKKITIASRDYIQKKYNSIERFSCELKYARYFKKKKILVPIVHSYDKKSRVITLEKIDGQVKDVLSNNEIKRCLDILFKIIHACGLEMHNTRETNKYVSKARLNIAWWCRQHNQSVNYKELESRLQKLKKVCYISFFKDAKPANWVFQKDKIYAIDFDYVKKSFFLADIAQLLSYVSLQRKINSWLFVSYYLKKVVPQVKDYRTFYIPFLLALINSNIASKIHRKDLPLVIERKFNEQNKLILKELKVI